ncbi:hypothetical protein MMC07_005778, partial [Pseudocyphellaria aurata]|nr:hypothetical protein [Pseudocyphellaria aurata]
MGSTPPIAASEYWGYLVRSDKSPSPLFEQLLLGIANYINDDITPWDTQCLTPTKLAAFYRLVGGDYDSLFLETDHPSLSFIYQSLGCYHSLQPGDDPFAPPSIPALTPQGFVRWQTVQVLLDPEEHVPFLQEAVKRFEIINPSDGGPFPRHLPRDAFPGRPDLEMTEWHENVRETLLLEAQASQPPSDRELEYPVASPVISEHSVANATSYLPNPHLSAGVPHINLPFQAIPHPLRPNFPAPAPSSPERRRHSVPPRNLSSPVNWPRDGPAPEELRASTYHSRSRPRSPSTISTVSSSSSSSSQSTDSRSPSPTRLSPSLPIRERRHSSSSLQYSPRDYPSPHPYSPHYGQSQLAPSSRNSYFPPQPYPPGPPRPNTRGLNVRWRDVNSVFQLPGSAPGTPGEEIRALESRRERGRDVEWRRDGGRRMASPLRGVSGRRYAAEGMAW